MELYINNKLADLNLDEQFLWSRELTDYKNPTIIKNSWTKTITLPGTINNEMIFGNISDEYSVSKIFNASKRTPFYLIDNGILLEKGYLKLENIIKADPFHNYSVTLYGDLGNCLYFLSNIEDPDTGDNREMTLSDIVPDISFSINKDLVIRAWSNLNEDYEDLSSELDKALTFIISYDGVPNCTNFDPQKIWTSVKKNGAVIWDGKCFNNNFPAGVMKNEDDISVWYGFIDTGQTKTAPSDRYAMIEVDNGLQPIEIRDFRSYLIRPAIRLRYIFDKMNDYLTEHTKYSLDMTSYFFETSDFNDIYITLPMLYEIDPEVESGTGFTLKQILELSDTPLQYLLSFCKTFGIYLDIDINDNLLVLKPFKEFYQRFTYNIDIDTNNDIEINPLSFSVNNYIFNWNSGSGQFYDDYKKKYSTSKNEVEYGQTKIFTGYSFDNNSEELISDNIFRGAVECIENYGLFRNNLIYKQDGTIIEEPVALRGIVTPKLKFFNTNKSTNIPIFDETGAVKTYENDIYPNTIDFTINLSDSPTGGCENATVPNTDSDGYFYAAHSWDGLRRGIWSDSYPRLQFHNEDRSGTDGSNILIKFNRDLGFVQTKTGYCTTNTNTGLSKWNDEGDPIKYLLSDDYPYLKKIEGKNCYYDNYQPDTAGNYITVIDRLPIFSRMDLSLQIINQDTSNETSRFLSGNILDFNFSRETYINNLVINGYGIYDRYWKPFIGDLYDINTRILTGRIKIPNNFSSIFKNFYNYKSTSWIISSINDLDLETGIGTATLIKINDADNYSYKDGDFVIEGIGRSIGQSGGTVKIPFLYWSNGKRILNLPVTVKYDIDVPWIKLTSSTGGHITLSVQTTNTNRTGYINFLYNNKITSIKINQYNY